MFLNNLAKIKVNKIKISTLINNKIKVSIFIISISINTKELINFLNLIKLVKLFRKNFDQIVLNYFFSYKKYENYKIKRIQTYNLTC